MKEKIVQTAGREQLGSFAPSFAHLNDDVLFGEVWNEEAIDVKTKCIINTILSAFLLNLTFYFIYKLRIYLLHNWNHSFYYRIHIIGIY